MIVSLSVADGFRSEIRAKATGFMGAAVMVPPGQGPINDSSPFDRNLSYIHCLDSIPGVASVCPVACRPGMIKSDEGIAGLCFKGVDSLYDFSFYGSSLVEGSLPVFSGRISQDILISSRLASRMGFGVGDKVTAYFVGENTKVRSFVICGLFDAQLEDIDLSLAIVDIRQVQRVSGWTSDEVSSIEIRAGGEASLDGIRDRVEEVESSLSDDGDQPLFVLSIKSICSNLFDWLALLDLNVVMILALMMAVASFNMISSLLIMLFRRIRMIGVLKSVGMTDGGVTRVFLLRAASIVGKGLLVGNAVALALILAQKYLKIITLDPASYFVKYVPVHIAPAKILLLDAASFAVIMAVLSLCSLFIARVSPERTMRVD